MARKPVAALLLGIWLGLFSLEFSYGFGFSGDSKMVDVALVGLGEAIEISEDGDGVAADLLSRLRDAFPSTTHESPHSDLSESKRLSKRASEIYTLQHAFLL